MKKPGWVRFFGWSSWFCLAMFVSWVLLRNEPGMTPQAGLGAIFFLLLSGPCLFMWLIGTIVHTFQRKNAELQANAIAEGIRRAKAAGVTPAPPAPQRVMTSPLGLTGERRK